MIVRACLVPLCQAGNQHSLPYKENMLGRDGSKWIGYIAVTKPEKKIKPVLRRNILVALKGTDSGMTYFPFQDEQ